MVHPVCLLRLFEKRRKAGAGGAWPEVEGEGGGEVVLAGGLNLPEMLGSPFRTVGAPSAPLSCFIDCRLSPSWVTNDQWVAGHFFFLLIFCIRFN